MNAKLIIALAAIIALAQAQAPALESLSSKIVSISDNVQGPQRTPLLSSAVSAYSRISSQIAASHATAVATQISSVISDSVSASLASSSAANVLSSATSALNSASASASALAQSQAPNAATTLAAGSNYLLQLSALAAVFIASFVVMLA